MNTTSLDLEKLDSNPLTWLNMKGNNPTFRKKTSQPVLDPTSFLSNGNFKGFFLLLFEGNMQSWMFSISEKIITISFWTLFKQSIS